MNSAIAYSAAALAGAYALPSLAALPAGRVVFPTIRSLNVDGQVGLTFDDGPQPEAAEAFVDALDQMRVTATFFMSGEQVRRSPGSALRIAEAGHEIASHGYRHRNHLRISPAATMRDMHQADEVIKGETGKTPKLFRPPYGVFNLASWTTCRKLGYERVLWNQWGKDWEARATATTIQSTVLKSITDGDIVLLHDAERYSAAGSWRRTLAALGPLVESLRGLSLEPVSVGQLLAAAQR